MTPRKPINLDAITLDEAVALTGYSRTTLTRFRREGLLSKLDGYPSWSRAELKALVADPWLNGVEAGEMLGISHNRVSQLAVAERIPVRVLPSGARVYRRSHLELYANARAAGRV